MEVKPKVTANALTRLEMAREKARIMGKRLSTTISELEQAADKWKEDKELKEAKLTYREPDDSPIAIASVPLKVIDRARRDEEIIWKQHRLHPEERPRQIKLNAAIICTIAQHLKAREWARARGKTRRQQDNGEGLEKLAEQWQRQKELEQRGFPRTNQRSTSW